jgi:hypothetical protein
MATWLQSAEVWIAQATHWRRVVQGRTSAFLPTITLHSKPLPPKGWLTTAAILVCGSFPTAQPFRSCLFVLLKGCGILWGDGDRASAENGWPPSRSETYQLRPMKKGLVSCLEGERWDPPTCRKQRSEPFDDSPAGMLAIPPFLARSTCFVRCIECL